MPSLPTDPRKTDWPLDPEGRRLGLILLAIAFVAFVFQWCWLLILALVLLVIILGFFRDPPRRITTRPGAVVSPADGTVDKIYINEDPDFGPVGGPVISIFLSVFNVHVNRAPVAGVVERLHYKPGGFLDARLPESSRLNESNWIYMQSGRHTLTVRQISGKIARRIVCRVQPGQAVARGERIGIIRFGSRTELILPPEARVAVELGAKVRGASDIVAWLPE